MRIYLKDWNLQNIYLTIFEAQVLIIIHKFSRPKVKHIENMLLKIKIKQNNR